MIESLDVGGYARAYYSKLNEVLSKLKIEVDKMFKWYQNNDFKSNSEICHLLTTCKSEVDIKVSGN